MRSLVCFSVISAGLVLAACEGQGTSWRGSRDRPFTPGSVVRAPAPPAAARTETPDADFGPIAHIWLLDNEYLKIDAEGLVQVRSADLVPEANWVDRGAVSVQDDEFFYSYALSEEQTARYQLIPRPNDQLLIVNLNVERSATDPDAGSRIASLVTQDMFNAALENATAARTPPAPSETPGDPDEPTEPAEPEQPTE